MTATDAHGQAVSESFHLAVGDSGPTATTIAEDVYKRQFQIWNAEPNWFVGVSFCQDAVLPSKISSLPSRSRSTISMASEPSRENKQGIASSDISDCLTDRCVVP